MQLKPKCGNVAFVKSDLKLNFTIQKINEFKFLQIQIHLQPIDFYVIATYRPPCTNLDTFLGAWSLLLQKKEISYAYNMIFVRDININIMENDIHIHKYLDILYECGFVSTINPPTTRVSCLDHIFLKATYSQYDKIFRLVIDMIYNSCMIIMLFRYNW